MSWIKGCSQKSCCSPSVLQQIYNLLCSFFTSLKRRWIDSPELFSNYENINETGVVVATRAAKVEEWQIFNSHSAPQYVRLYNIGDRLPTAADDANPELLKKRLLVPAQSGENLADLNELFPAGLSIRGTLQLADGDNTPPAAPIIVNLGYKFA